MRPEDNSKHPLENISTSSWSAVNVVTSAIAGLLIAVMTTAIAWRALPHEIIFLWLTSVGAAFSFGIFQALKYQSSQQGFFDNQSRVIIATGFFGLLWSVPGLFLVSSSNLNMITMYSITVVLMLSWASIYFSTVRHQFLVFSVPFTSPLIFQLIHLEQDAVYLGAIVTASLVILTICTRTIHFAIQSGIKSLTDSLSKLHTQLSLQLQEKQKTISEVIDNEQHMREIVDATIEGILVHNGGAIIDINRTLSEMVGISREKAVGRHVTEFIHENSLRLLNEKLQINNPESFEVTILRKNRESMPAELRAKTYSYKNKQVQIITVRDITDKKLAEKNIMRLSNIDLLTGLPNRKQFKDSLARMILEAKETSKIFALMIVDIDNFKLINETHGHNIGDELLQYVSLKISETVRSHDVLARWGDDEFAILVNDVENLSEVTHITKRMQNELSEFVVLSNYEIYASASIGCTIYSDECQSLEGLISNAEVAVRRAKENGHNSIEFINSELDRNSGDRYELENSLRKAIENNEFELHYQPKINLANCTVTGVEALIRWRHPTKGLISPLEFIPLAEQTGMIVPIGAWVLDEACRQINTWKRIGLDPVPIAVNLSLRQLKNINMLDVIMATLARHEVDSELLEIEITESSVAENYEQAVELMHGLSEAGVTISIDDFGTGYSSLSYLKKFPVDYLKIDRSFIKYIPDDVDDTAITTTILAMAENLGLKVIAEGVETQEQLNFIQKKGCFSAQGFLISKPLPEESITKWLYNPPTSLLFEGFARGSAM